jgi:hypothetical protein
MLNNRDASIALLLAAALLILALLGGALAYADDLGVLAESLFDRLDLNQDGLIGADEAKAARARMFERIDADYDGVLTATEIETAKDNAQKRRANRLANLAKARAAMPSPSERFAELDQDKNGKVTRDEFVNARSWFELLAKSPGGISKADFANFLIEPSEPAVPSNRFNLKGDTA